MNENTPKAYEPINDLRNAQNYIPVTARHLAAAEEIFNASGDKDSEYRDQHIRSVAAIIAKHEQNANERMIQHFIDRADCAADNIEGEDNNGFIQWETRMVCAVETLALLGVKFDPITGKRSPAESLPSLERELAEARAELANSISQDDLLYHLKKRGHEVGGLDGDESPAVIVASWFHGQIEDLKASLPMIDGRTRNKARELLPPTLRHEDGNGASHGCVEVMGVYSVIELMIAERDAALEQLAELKADKELALKVTTESTLEHLAKSV